MLDEIHRKKNFRRMRISTWNRTGGNRDKVRIEAGATHAFEQLVGPGIIKHLWMTVAKSDEHCYRNLRLVVRFDEADVPQVDIPLADFFLFGHGCLADVNSLPIQVSRQPQNSTIPYVGSMNCVFPMPFEHKAEVAVVNTGAAAEELFCYIDWEQHPALEGPVLHFHTMLNEEHTQVPAGDIRAPHGLSVPDGINLSDRENYVFLDLTGYEGHYVGTGLSIDCRPEDAGKWWEGDDMFVIDGEAWPPRLHGTGTEDYFNLAWGFRKVECRPEYGVTWLEKRPGDLSMVAGRFSMYRFHLHDPIPFERSLRASIEHGHANDCETRYRSVAYWYGRRVT